MDVMSWNPYPKMNHQQTKLCKNHYIPNIQMFIEILKKVII